MKIKTGLIFLLLWSLFSCQQQGSLIIEGNLSHVISDKIYLSKLTPDGLFPKDSVRITDGKFKFKIKPGNEQEKYEPAFYRLSLPGENYIVTLGRPGERLTITADARDLVRSYTVSGGEDARLMWELDRKLTHFIDTVDRLYARYLDHIYDDSVKMIVEEKYNRLVDQHTDDLLFFIRNNSGSLSSVIAFYQKYNRRIFIDETENLSLLKDIYRKLSGLYPENGNVIYLGRRIEIIEKNINKQRKLS